MQHFFFLQKRHVSVQYHIIIMTGWPWFADYGFFKLEAKTKTESGVEFTTSGNSSSDTGKVSGHLETKYKWSEYGKSGDG